MKLFLTTALALQAVYALAQYVNVTAGSYSKCDTCFIFTAHPNGQLPPYTFQWTFTGSSPATDTGKTVTYCSQYIAIHDTDSLYLAMTYIDSTFGPQIAYYSNALTNLLPDLDNSTVQPICIVTVDTSVNKNLIVWEQTTDTSVASYNLYKETATSGVYNILANIPRHTFSTYTDISSQPDVKSARYYLTTKDSCNFSSSESPPSASHKTIHLTVNSGISPAWNLIWETYDGLSALKYRIWRNSVSNGWQLIDSVSSSSTTYTDLIPPAGLLSYVIEMISPNVCNPSLRTSQAYSAYSSSLSNLANNSVTGISENNFSLIVQIFPNPFSSATTLQTDKIFKDATLTVYNSFGQTVKQITPITIGAGRTIILHRDNLPSGVYFIRVTQDNKTITTDKLMITD